MSWYADSKVVIDEETKITEFDYENWIHPDLLPKDHASNP